MTRAGSGSVDVTQRTVDRGHHHETCDQGSRPPAPAHGRTTRSFRIATPLTAAWLPPSSEVFSHSPSRGTADGHCVSFATRQASPPPRSSGRRSRRRSLRRVSSCCSASPEAAASHWVDQEVRWWRENRSHDTVLIVLTDGELGWDEARGDFEASAGGPARPPRLVSARAAVGRSALGERRAGRVDAQPALSGQRRRGRGTNARLAEGRADR